MFPKIIPILLSFFFFFLLLLPALALQVTPGSPCAQQCLDNPNLDPFSPESSTTTAADITCTDDGFVSSTQGNKFEECLTCLQKSEKVNGTESDLSWLLYNLRYTLGTCLFNPSLLPESQRINSPCLIPSACAPLSSAITEGNVSELVKTPVDLDDEYSFCKSGVLPGKWEGACTECLRSTTDQVYLANFFTVLQSACLQKPAPGSLLSLSGPIFSTNVLNATNTTITTSSSDDSTSSETSSLNTPTIVGIAVGAALTLLGGIGLFWVYFRRQRRPAPHPEAAKSPTADSPSSPFSDTKNIITSASSLRTVAPPMYEMSLLGKSSTPSLAASAASSVPGSIPYVRGFTHSRSYSGNSVASYHTVTTADIPIITTSSATLVPHPAYIPGRTSRASTSSAPSTSAPATHSTTSTASCSPGRKRTKPSPLATEILNTSAYATSDSESSDAPGPAPRASVATMNALRTAMQDPGFSIPPPPPPQQGRPQVPALSIPNVGHLRGGKRFAPPAIMVQGASPIAEVDEGQQEVIGHGQVNSKPIIGQGEERFRDETLFVGRR